MDEIENTRMEQVRISDLIEQSIAIIEQIENIPATSSIKDGGKKFSIILII